MYGEAYSKKWGIIDFKCRLRNHQKAPGLEHDDTKLGQGRDAVKALLMTTRVDGRTEQNPRVLRHRLLNFSQTRNLNLWPESILCNVQ